MSLFDELDTDLISLFHVPHRTGQRWIPPWDPSDVDPDAKRTLFGQTQNVAAWLAVQSADARHWLRLEEPVLPKVLVFSLVLAALPTLFSLMLFDGDLSRPFGFVVPLVIALVPVALRAARPNTASPPHVYHPLTRELYELLAEKASGTQGWVTHFEREGLLKVRMVAGSYELRLAALPTGTRVTLQNQRRVYKAHGTSEDLRAVVDAVIDEVFRPVVALKRQPPQLSKTPPESSRVVVDFRFRNNPQLPSMTHHRVGRTLALLSIGGFPALVAPLAFLSGSFMGVATALVAVVSYVACLKLMVLPLYSPGTWEVIKTDAKGVRPARARQSVHVARGELVAGRETIRLVDPFELRLFKAATPVVRVGDVDSTHTKVIIEVARARTRVRFSLNVEADAAEGLPLLETDGALAVGTDFVTEIWPQLAYYAELNGRRPAFDLDLPTLPVVPSTPPFASAAGLNP